MGRATVWHASVLYCKLTKAGEETLVLGELLPRLESPAMVERVLAVNVVTWEDPNEQQAVLTQVSQQVIKRLLAR